MTIPPLPTIYNICPPAAIVDDAAFTFTAVDTKPGGVEYGVARFIFILGAIDANMAVPPKIAECETSDGSYADITGAAITASKVTAAAGDNDVLVIDVKLDGRMRYLQPAATGGNGDAGMYMACICELHFPNKVSDASAVSGAVTEWIKV